jgi:hypothetical protein
MMLRLIAQILELLQSPFKLFPPLDHNRLVVDLELAAVMLGVLAEYQVWSVEWEFFRNAMRIENADATHRLISKLGQRQLPPVPGTTSWIFLLFTAIGLRPSLFLYTLLMTML